MQIDSQALTAAFQNTVLSLPNIISAVVIFVVMLVVAALAAKFVQRASQRRGIRLEATLLLSRATRWIIIAIGIVWALQQVNFNVTGFVAALGILAFTIGFALQDISKNFVAGILLLWQQPFNIGDVISVAGFTGKVSDVSIRATEMRTFDGLQVLIPNSEVYTSPITNFTKASVRRLALRIGVSYGTDLGKAEKAIRKVLSSHEFVLDTPEPFIAVDRLNESSVDFLVRPFCKGEHYFDLRYSLPQLVKEEFDRQKIEIPFPHRKIIMAK